MTVPAFSPSVVLPGAPGAPAGRGASGGEAGLFEGLLASLVAGGADADPMGKGRSPADAGDTDRTDPADAKTATTPQDAGLAFLLAAPGAAPATPSGSETDGADSTPDAAARQTRIPVLAAAGPDLPAGTEASTPADADAAPAEGKTPAVADAAAPPPRIDASIRATADRPGQTVPVADARPAPATPVPPLPVPADPARDVPPPTPTAAIAAEPAAGASAAAVQAGQSVVQTETPRPTPTIGDLRRAAAARGDRPAAAIGPAAAALAGAAPVKQAALAALEDALTSGNADATPADDSGAVAEDAGEPAETRQPSLPGEARAAAVHAAAVDAATAAPRGSPETVAKLAADIIRKLEGQSTRFDLELNPHGLGKVDVAIEIDRAGKLTAAMTFDSSQSAADLRGRSAELRQALEQAGFSVSDGGLTFDTAGQGAGFGGRDAAQQQHQDRAWNGRAFQRAQSGAEDADLSLNGASLSSVSRTLSGVDIRI